jgi:glycosyltransferase EpsJ
VDDGSSDGSGAIADAYAGQYENVRVLHKENGGLSSARNAGIADAAGNYLGFVDSDDWAEPEMFQELWKAAESVCADLAVCGYFRDFPAEEQSETYALPSDLFAKTPEEVGALLLAAYRAGWAAFCWNKLYRTDFLRASGVFCEKTQEPHEDLCFNFALFPKINRAALLAKAYYHYVSNGAGSLAARFYAHFNEAAAQKLSALRAALPLFPLEWAERQRLFEREYIRTMRACVQNMYRAGSRLSAKERQSFLRALPADETLFEYLSREAPENGLDKLFRFALDKKNPAIADCLYKTLYFGKNRFSGVYRRFRKKLYPSPAPDRAPRKD